MRKVDAFQAFCSGVAVLGLFFGACSSDEALFRDTGDQGDMTDAGEDVRFTDDNRRDAATDSGGKVEVSVDARSVIEAARQTDVGAVTPPKSDLDWQSGGLAS